MSFLIFGLAFLYIPIVILIIYAFNDSATGGVWTGFSFKWFSAVFKNEELLTAALTSLKIAALSATGATIIGVCAAAVTAKDSHSGKHQFLGKMIQIPILIPEIIIGFSLLMLFIFSEKLFGLPRERGVVTVTIGHIMASVAYVHMTLRDRLMSFDKDLEEAALDLGAKPLKVFVTITLPVISNSIFAGWLLAFTLSLDDLVIASFLAGPGATTLPLLIFSNLRVGITPEINAFATLFIVIVGLCLLVAYLLTTKDSSKGGAKTKLPINLGSVNKR